MQNERSKRIAKKRYESKRAMLNDYYRYARKHERKASALRSELATLSKRILSNTLNANELQKAHERYSLLHARYSYTIACINELRDEFEFDELQA